MGFFQMLLPLVGNDSGATVIERTTKALMLLFRMLHQLVFPSECFLAGVLRAFVFSLIVPVVLSNHVPVKVALFTKGLLV